jgi:phenylacetate-CoA ligase
MMRDMTSATAEDRSRLLQLDRKGLQAHQLARFKQLLEQILPHNQFYREKFADLQLPSMSLDELGKLPFTYKEELMAARRSGQLSRNQTFSTERYVRLHQTSGTRGRPMLVVDTAEDWRWWMHCWQFVLDAVGIEPSHCVFMAFSFGPFVGFWSAHDSCVERGCLVVPGGGLSTLGRLELLRAAGGQILFCTPSYALHMAESGATHQLDVASLGVQTIVLAGEPGGSIPSTRERIAAAWQAQVFDHAGASEIGPWGYGDPDGKGLYINESEFLPEFLSVAHGTPAEEGELSELVLTALGRVGCPIIRYRTGDLVRPRWSKSGRGFVFLDGGILGRADDMLVIRGVNIFPSAIEHIVRSFPEIVEYRVCARKQGAMDFLYLEIEDRLAQPQRVLEELRTRLGLKVEVKLAAIGSLPRFEGKGRRFIDERGKG